MSKYIGKIFKTNACGNLVVIGTEAGSYKVRFIETGTEKKAQLNDIKSGMVKDPLVASAFGFGYIGIGEHKTSVNGRETRQYKVWKNMIARCYDKKTQELNPTYAGCTVCEEWRDFQVFSNWFNSQSPKNGYHLDKDKIKKGNKVYCPEYCSFISPSENVAIAHGSSGRVLTVLSPEGEVHKVEAIDPFCSANGISHSSFRRAMKSKNFKSLKGWIIES